MRISRFQPTGNSRGCAFVTFRERSSAELAVQRCHGVDLKGRVLKVMMADRRKPSDPPPSDGASAEATAPSAAAAPAVVVAARKPAAAVAKAAAASAAASGAAADEPAQAAARLPLVLEMAEGGDAPRMWGLEALLARVGAAGRVGAAEAARGGDAWREEAMQLVAEASEVMREAGTERAGRQLRAAESLLRTLDAAASEDPDQALQVAFRGALRSERRAARRKLELTIDAELAAVDAQLAALDALDAGDAAQGSAAPPTDTEEEPAPTAEALLASVHDAVAAAEEAHLRAAAAHGDALRAELARRRAHAQGLTGSAAAAARRALLREAGRQAALLVAVQMGEPAEVRVWGRGGATVPTAALVCLPSPHPRPSRLSRPSPISPLTPSSLTPHPYQSLTPLSPPIPPSHLTLLAPGGRGASRASAGRPNRAPRAPRAPQRHRAGAAVRRRATAPGRLHCAAAAAEAGGDGPAAPDQRAPARALPRAARARGAPWPAAGGRADRRRKDRGAVAIAPARGATRDRGSGTRRAGRYGRGAHAVGPLVRGAHSRDVCGARRQPRSRTPRNCSWVGGRWARRRAGRRGWRAQGGGLSTSV